MSVQYNTSLWLNAKASSLITSGVWIPPANFISQLSVLWDHYVDIPINHDLEDEVIWTITESGEYSMKSAYSRLRNTRTKAFPRKLGYCRATGTMENELKWCCENFGDSDIVARTKKVKSKVSCYSSKLEDSAPNRSFNDEWDLDPEWTLPQPTQCKWLAPPPGFVMVNNVRGGIRAVAKEEKGKVLRACAENAHISSRATSSKECEARMSKLEAILDSKPKLPCLMLLQIFIIEDRTELETFVPSAAEIKRFYDRNFFEHNELKLKLKSLWLKFDSLLEKSQGSFASQYKGTDETFNALRKKLSKYHEKILHCLDNLGFICAYEAAKVCLETARDSNITEESELYRLSYVQCKHFLDEVLHIIEESLPHDHEELYKAGFDQSRAIKKGYMSPKLYEIIGIFLSFGNSKKVLCLIFVERIITAKVISRFISKLNYLSHLTVSYLTGGNASADALNPKMQKETLDLFRCGKVNMLFTTDVAEEGLDVPNCSCVIRFDLPKSTRSYVQSRGRARQTDSEYVLMIERGNIKQRDLLFEIFLSEYSVTDTTANRDPDACIPEISFADQETNVYMVESTGASVTADSSVSLIHKYCEKLPKDKYFIPKPIFTYSQSGVCHSCILILPPNAALQRIQGPMAKNVHLSKQLVCLEACRELHNLGVLDDHLLPNDDAENDVIGNTKNCVPGAGTTKKKELHNTITVRALSGTWGEKTDGITLNAYKLDFSCDQVDEFYSGFVLLIEAKLDDDAANTMVDLFLIPKKLVKSTVRPCREIQLDGDQLKKARQFQEFFFNGIFGKLFTGSKSSGTPREFLLKREDNSLWSSSNMYLLLPLESTLQTHEFCKIDWRGVNATASVVEYLWDYSLVVDKHSSTSSSETETNSSDTIHFANSCADRSALTDMVVYAIHTGKLYSILELVTDKYAQSSFEVESNGGVSEYSSYEEYFNKKYGIVLQRPEQPLLRLKQSHNPHNLLARPKSEGESNLAVEKPLQHVHMPPELLISINVPLSVIKSFYLLPSLMHRLESLMLANQLREEISYHPSNCHISSSLIYIRDSAFDPRRWVAPGQCSLHPAPCKCGVDSSEVPLENKFETEDIKVIVGKACDRGHRWMCSKTISDCVEALIGAYFVGGGLRSALAMMKWFGIDAEVEPDLVEKVISTAALRCYTPAANDELELLESKLHYKFSNKGLLLEAITHASGQELGINYCYQTFLEHAVKLLTQFYGDIPSHPVPPSPDIELTVEIDEILDSCLNVVGHVEFSIRWRLEFLGDSVLDILVTWYLFQNHTEIEPGELTDLRSACVMNENFAEAAIRHNLQDHLHHSSGLLLEQITEYKNAISDVHQRTKSLGKMKYPKALGDLVESIAGAILVDTKLHLDKVRQIFLPLLSPIVTPEKLELAPLRELNELCSHLGYFVKETLMPKGDMVHAELQLQLENCLLIGKGCERNKKAARGEAARQLLQDLEDRDILHSKHVSKRTKPLSELQNGPSFIKDLEQANDASAENISSKRKRADEGSLPVEPAADSILVKDHFEENHDLNPTPPVAIRIKMKKGGPRSSLYEVCRTMQWPMPTFSETERKSRVALEIGEGPDRRKGFNIFVSKISLHIPKYGPIVVTGDQRADKKSAQDSAALTLLYELGKRNKCEIKDV
ncbi:hypothetical protein GIB67_007464 [Kingdonia uniflora]|uniref:Dicer-like 3 n=1 Tax=Kingdonia uniflora TaxID=39325 RepID=A0A7J7MMD2_9MAGN|nr:hypothetical protein GIB67_007464 [Kingdonia uniflora]